MKYKVRVTMTVEYFAGNRNLSSLVIASLTFLRLMCVFQVFSKVLSVLMPSEVAFSLLGV